MTYMSFVTHKDCKLLQSGTLEDYITILITRKDFAQLIVMHIAQCRTDKEIAGMKELNQFGTCEHNVTLFDMTASNAV